MSGWISSENVFVAPTRKGETLPKWADLLKNELFVVLEEGESFSTRVCSPAEQRLETGLRCFPKLEKNWSRQLTMNNYFDWKEWINPLIPIHFFGIWLYKSDHYPWEFKHPAKDANEHGPSVRKPCWKKSHSWTQRKWLIIIQIQEALWRNETT